MNQKHVKHYIHFLWLAVGCGVAMVNLVMAFALDHSLYTCFEVEWWRGRITWKAIGSLAWVFSPFVLMGTLAHYSQLRNVEHARSLRL